MTLFQFNNTTLREAVRLFIKNKLEAMPKWGEIEYWDTSQVTDMANMFYITEFPFSSINKSSFNSDLSRWNVGQVKYMNCMFCGASSFNADLSRWDTGNVIDMSGMFFGATSFNSDLSQWDTRNVKNMEYMFCKATSFQSDLSRWNIGEMPDMHGMLTDSGIHRQWDIKTIGIPDSHPYRKASRIRAFIQFPFERSTIYNVSMYI